MFESKAIITNIDVIKWALFHYTKVSLTRLIFVLFIIIASTLASEVDPKSSNFQSCIKDIFNNKILRDTQAYEIYECGEEYNASKALINEIIELQSAAGWPPHAKLLNNSDFRNKNDISVTMLKPGTVFRIDVVPRCCSTTRKGNSTIS